MSTNTINIEYHQHVAIITLDIPERMNSLSRKLLSLLGERMREVEGHDEVTVTLLIGSGKFFSAGADMSDLKDTMANPTRAGTLTDSMLHNFDLARTFYRHPKILVVGLNGPVIGIPAALVSYADFVYASPSAYLHVPFSSLGLAAEAGASRALRERLGTARAKVALLMSKRIPSAELLSCGFVNKIIESPGGKEPATAAPSFRDSVLAEINRDFGPRLNSSSLLEIKDQMCREERDYLDGVGVRETYAAADRIVRGTPQKHLQALKQLSKAKL